MHRWLRLTDQDVFRLMLAAVAGHRVSGESPWLLIVGPSSSVKTELLPMLSRTAGTVRLSSLTARTFASGLVTQEAEPSPPAAPHRPRPRLEGFHHGAGAGARRTAAAGTAAGRSTTVTSTNIGARARSCIGRTMWLPGRRDAGDRSAPRGDGAAGAALPAPAAALRRGRAPQWRAARSASHGGRRSCDASWRRPPPPSSPICPRSRRTSTPPSGTGWSTSPTSSPTPARR